MIHLNHAGTSWPKPEATLAAVREALECAPCAAAALLERATDEVCRCLGIADRERFLLTPGGTAALALALGDLALEAGQVVMTSALEHHALARPVDKLVRERGLAHEVMPYSPDEPVALEFAERRLARGDVKLVAFTTASNVSGQRLPVRELTTLARRYGALSLLDAAQTVGLDDTPLPDLGADIVAFTGHKAAQGPHGIGGLWAARHVHFESPWAVCEIGESRAECSPFPTYCDVGSVNLAAAIGLAAGLSWALAERAAMLRAIQFAETLAREIAQRPGLWLAGSAESARIPAVSFRPLAGTLESVERGFAERGLHVRAGQHCAPLALDALGAPEGTLRVSFGPSNREEDLAACLDAIDALG